MIPMVFIMRKRIGLHQVKTIGFGIVTQIFQQGSGDPMASILGRDGKANDRFDFFTVVRHFFCEIKIDVVVRLFVIGIAPAHHFSLHIGQISLHAAAFYETNGLFSVKLGGTSIATIRSFPVQFLIIMVAHAIAPAPVFIIRKCVLIKKKTTNPPTIQASAYG